VINDELIHVHHLILFHFEISFLVAIDIHLRLKYIFVDIHLVYALIHHVLQVINDDQVQVEDVDNEDYQTVVLL